MGDSRLELTIIAAEGLKNVNLMGKKINPYAIAWIDPLVKKSTQTLQNSGLDPVWNETLCLPLQAQLLNNPNAAIMIQVLSAAPIKTKLVGTTTLMLNEITRICNVTDRDAQESLALQLWRPSGRAYGILKVSFKLMGSSISEIHLPLNLKGSSINETHLPLNLNGRTVTETHDVSSSNWAVSKPQSYDMPVQGIPVTSLYPQISPSVPDHLNTVEYGALDEQCAYSFAPLPPPPYMPLPPTAPPMKQSNAPKNFLIGLLSGAVAAVLVGSAVL